MQIDINNLRSLLEESRATREADKQDFQYRVAELRAQLEEQSRRHAEQIEEILTRVEAYLHEHAIAKPSWWPHRD